jgi:FkbM family methyltransferase
VSDNQKQPANRKLKVVFGMMHPGYYRNFELVIKRLCAAGVDVHVYCTRPHATIREDELDLPGPGPGTFQLTFAKLDKDSSWVWPGRVRLLRDILLYSRPDHGQADDLKARFAGLQKKELFSRRTVRILQRIAAVLPLSVNMRADRVLASLDHRIRPSASADKAIEKLRPDLLMVTPLVNFSSREVDLVKAARRKGVPTMLAVASWDNLTNKGIIKIKPHYVAVWNQHMAREANKIHGIAKSKISIVGASAFDYWFDRQPTRSRASFCEQLGFDPDKPIIVYLCSTASIARSNEDEVIEAWTAAVRGAEDDRVRTANLLIRPHPLELSVWSKILPDATAEMTFRFTATVWPIRPTTPVTEQGRADFFDTLYYADAVVGLNTSAMIEAAILRKPVLTFIDHPHSRGQVGNLHFKYLSESGSVQLAPTLAEHIKQLAAVMQGQYRHSVCDRFVDDFVRPLGRETPASALLAQQVLEILDGDQDASAKGVEHGVAPLDQPSEPTMDPALNVDPAPKMDPAPNIAPTLVGNKVATLIRSLNTEKREEVVAMATAPKYLQVNGSALRFHIHSAVEEGRIMRFKEPWTIDWLRNIPPGSVLYDVGANIGVTALIAAEGASRNVQVVAIEPFPANFASLVKNIQLNNLSDQVMALPFGLNSRTAVVPLRWAAAQVGTSRHSFGTIVNPKGPQELASVASHHCVGYRLDDLVALPGLPFPTHIKIDVDGSELDVLSGAHTVLRDRRCRAVQIEVSEPGASHASACRTKVVEQMISFGYVLKAEHPHRVVNIRDIQFEKLDS